MKLIDIPPYHIIFFLQPKQWKCKSNPIMLALKGTPHTQDKQKQGRAEGWS